MKKFGLALLAGLMLVSFASQALAEVTVGGTIGLRYCYWNNLFLNHGAASYDSVNFFTQRTLLNVNAKITEGLEGMIELDTATDVWGQEATSTAPLGNIPNYLNHPNNSRNLLYLRQAWINFMVPGLPIGVKIGHQPLALGHGIWLDTSRYGSEAILVYSKPIPELLTAFAYVQGSQQSAAGALTGIPVAGASNRFILGNSTLDQAKRHTLSDDADFYAVLANYTWMENNTAGINFTYVDDAASLPALGLSGASIWATNTALVLDGTIAGLTYKGEVDWLYVEAKNLASILKGNGNADQSYIVSAWAAMLGASYNAGPVTVAMDVAYGTGNDDSNPGIFYNPGAAGNAVVNESGGWRDTAYYTPYNSTSYNYTYLYNDKIGQGPLGAGGGNGYGDGYGGFGLANTGYVRVGVSGSPMDRMKAALDVYALRASETMIPNQSRWLGWEVDANVSYKLYDNLTLTLLGGVFVPGPWYDFKGHADVAGTNTDVLTDENDLGSPLKRSTAWGVESRLSMKF